MTEIFLKTKITLKNIYLIPFTQVLTGLRHSHIHTCVCAKNQKTVFCFPIPIPLHQIIYEFIKFIAQSRKQRNLIGENQYIV